MLKPYEAKYSTIHAIRLEYRFVDTAQVYRNEKGVNKVFLIALTLLIINIRNYEFSNCYADFTPFNDPITSSDILLDEI